MKRNLEEFEKDLESDLEKDLRNTLVQLRNLEICTEQVLKKASEGRLRCSVNKGSYQYYIDGKYQNKTKRKFVKLIAQKEYCEQLMNRIKIQKSALEKLIKTIKDTRLDQVYEHLHPARKQLVEPFVKPVADKIEEFKKIQYEGKGFAEEDTTAYFTVNGERVRSKSEKIIADALCRKGIPYHYEFPLELKYKNRTVVVYPDFTVLNKRTGKQYILEHLGMMDKQSYFENAMWKIDTYEKNGILLGDTLLITHEATGSTLDTGVLEKYLERYLV